MLCGLWCEKVSSRCSLHIAVFSCLQFSLSSGSSGRARTPTHQRLWGFRERLHSSRFISTTNHGQVTKFSLRGLLSLIVGRQLLLQSFCYLPSSRERQHLAFLLCQQLLVFSFYLKENSDHQLIKVSYFSAINYCNDGLIQIMSFCNIF